MTVVDGSGARLNHPRPDKSPSGAGNSRLAGLLRRNRLAAGLTQEELADLAGVAVRTVRNLELGRVARPRRRTLEQIADRLGLTEADRHRLLDTRPAADDPADPSGVSLPGALPDFVGRHGPLRRITALAGPGGPRTVVLAGPPGIGKTSLAVRAAGALAPMFPTGAFFVSLRGMDDEPTTTADALSQVLAALGLESFPETVDGRTAAWRRVTGGGRGLLVLDNARDEAQVRPLLPAGSGWLTLVSSRNTLGGLSAAEHIVLGTLTDREAYGLLTEAVGADRIEMEPAAAAELARLCGGLPLALRVAANRLVIRPEWSVQALTERLRDEQHRLDRLHVGDLGVRSAFELSYRLLDEPARRTLRSLSAAPLPTYSPELVAALLDVDVPTAEENLDALVDAGLVNPSQVTGRFTLHDLLALFARARAGTEDDPADRLAAQDRLATHVLTRCTAAGLWLEPDQPRPPATPAGAFAGPVEGPVAGPVAGASAGPVAGASAGAFAGAFAGAEAALAWLDAEQAALWWAVRHVAARKRPAAVLAAARDLYWYSDRRHAALPWPEFFQLAVDAATALGDPRAEATQENNLGWALRLTRGSPDAAYGHHVKALRLGRAAGDATVVGWALRYLAAVLIARGDTGTAMSHLVEAETIFAGLRDRLAGIVVARAQAELLRSGGDLLAAQDVLEAALARWQSEVADHLAGFAVRGYLRSQLGMVLAELGETTRARTILTEALADFAAGDDPAESGAAHLALAEIAITEGDRDSAAEHLDRAAAVFVAAGERHRLADVSRVRRRTTELGDTPRPRSPS
ncbi:ATP-binding protein [Actinoplanes sp. NPDC051494]|uniref:ATP-binding protein n=1 Tax=Actinoplanes sp. NPDC051494 TaxID=3363907 RepID=UPI0037BA04AB